MAVLPVWLLLLVEKYMLSCAHIRGHTTHPEVNAIV
jgi:hypothetical protein